MARSGLSGGGKKAASKKRDRVAGKSIKLLLPGQPAPRTMTAGEALSFAEKARGRRQWPAVMAICEQLVKQQPGLDDAWLALFDASHQLGDSSRLEQSARSSLQAKPRWVPALVSLATALRLRQRHSEALPLLEKAVQLQPADPQIWNHLGIVQKELGQMAEALQSFNRCIALRKDFGEAYWNRSDLLRDPRPEDVAAMEKLLDHAALSPANRARLHYSLARAWEYLGDHERQFDHVEAGARCKRSSVDYDHAAEMRQMARIAEVITPQFLAMQHATPGASAAATPIFICGLPRSGTTLVEQILSSHPLVTAGDELMDLPLACSEQLRRLRCSRDFPDWVPEFGPADWLAVAERYMKSTRELQKTRYFTDKNLQNYKAIGIIARALPQAKIIYCEREPMDNLWGCYSQLFGDGLYFTYSQRELADTWNAANRLLRYWQQHLAERIHLLRYEQLVDDQEGCTRRLLDFVGLPWNEECLQFEQNSRAVRTSSAAQVRSALDRSRVDRWRPFADRLQPMREILQLD